MQTVNETMESVQGSRRRRARTVAAVAASLAALATPQFVHAQARPASRAVDPIQVTASAPPRGIGFRGFAMVDLQRMAARQTFDAVLGTPNLMGYGGGGDVLRLWRDAFARVAVSRTNKDGTRVIVFDDEAIPVGIGTSIRMMPIEIGGGWQIGRGRLGYYVGGSFLRVSYEETTEFDEPGEDTSATFNGSALFGGVSLRVGGPLAVGGEVQHRRLAGAIGQAGASAAFDEHDLGGVTFRVWIGVSR
jgi:hypothetical protein